MTSRTAAVRALEQLAHAPDVVLFAQTYDAVVIDEAHNLLASRSNYQSKHITQQRYGAVMLRRKVREDGLAIALSGTPFRSDLTNAWGTLNWCRPDIFGSFWRWAGMNRQACIKSTNDIPLLRKSIR